MRYLIILALTMISNFACAQDWNEWGFRFNFKLDTEETFRYQYKNLEVFFNDTYTYEKVRYRELKYDPITKEYSLLIDYGCISCGFTNDDFPPDLYLKLAFEYNFSDISFATVIPIYFKKSASFLKTKTCEKINSDSTDEFNVNLIYPSVINLGTIPVKHFLTGDYWKDNIETYEIIEVSAINSIQYKKAGQYVPRRMNRLIQLELKK